MRRIDRSLVAWSWAFIAVVAVLELGAHLWIQARVPEDESWASAAAFVRERLSPGDRVIAAPAWADPIARLYLGDLPSLRTASADDSVGGRAVWELSIRGASHRPSPPSLERSFGNVQVRMWPTSSDRMVFDFVERIDHAEVELGTAPPIPCPWVQAPVPGGGLGAGPLPPAERFVCDPSRPWLWVGATVMADLDLLPRRCVWQHPAGLEPVRTTFRDVLLDEEIVLSGGLDYNNARTDGDVPVRAAVFVDNELLGEMQIGDRDPWTHQTIDTSSFAGTTHDIRIETSVRAPYQRTFCWSAFARRTGDSR